MIICPLSDLKSFGWWWVALFQSEIVKKRPILHHIRFALIWSWSDSSRIKSVEILYSAELAFFITTIFIIPTVAKYLVPEQYCKKLATRLIFFTKDILCWQKYFTPGVWQLSTSFGDYQHHPASWENTVVIISLWYFV